MNRRYNVLMTPEEAKILISLYNPKRGDHYAYFEECVRYSLRRGTPVIAYGLAKKTFTGWDEFRDSRGFRLHEESYWPAHNRHGPHN